MSKRQASVVLAGLGLSVAGCASNAIVGHQLTQRDHWYGQLGITGHLNKVTVLRDSRLTRLSIIGDANTVTVEDDATLGKIEIWGQNNTVSIPASLVVRESVVGKGNQIIRRPARGKLAARSATQPATRP